MNFQTEENKLVRIISNYFLDTPAESKLSPLLRTLRLVNSPEYDLYAVFKGLQDLKLLLAGGAITALFSGANVNDLDFYMEDPSNKEAIIIFLSKYFTEPPFISENCITFKRKSKHSRKVWTVQLITRFSGDAVQIFKNFDFTITTGSYSFHNQEFKFGDRFFQDLGSRTLTFMGASEYPICALWRTKKYQDRGYKLPGSTMMHISLSIVRLEIKNYKELKQQLLGIDTMFLQNLFRDKSGEYLDELPVDYGKFIADAFEYLNVYSSEEEI